MQIRTTHKATDFDAAASVLAAKILYPEAVAVLPKSLNPNVRTSLSIHNDLFDVHTPDEIEFEAVMSLIIVDINRSASLQDPIPCAIFTIRCRSEQIQCYLSLGEMSWSIKTCRNVFAVWQ